MATDTIRGLLRFLGAHRLIALLTPAWAIGVTAVHESAHAVAVLAQGGIVTGFHVLPTLERWGVVDYAFPSGTSHSVFAIAVAPYVVWTAFACATVIWAMRGEVRSIRSGAAIFVFGFVVPLGDAANAAFPFLFGADNDLRVAFGSPTSGATLAVLLLALASTLVGYRLQRRLYGDLALAPAGFAVAVAGFFAGLAVLAGAI